MKQKLETINQVTTPNGRAGMALREWLPEMSQKMTHYTKEHRRLLQEATCTFEDYLPSDIVMKSVLPFLELPKRTIDEGGKESDLLTLLTCDDGDASIIGSSEQSYYTSESDDDQEGDEDDVSLSEEMDEEYDEEEEEECEE